MVQKVHPAEKINTGGEGFDENLIRVQFQSQFLPQKILNFRNQIFQSSAASRKNHEIIRVSDIVFCFESMFYKLVKFVHVDIHKKLGGEIAERQAGRETFYYSPKKPNDV